MAEINNQLLWIQIVKIHKDPQRSTKIPKESHFSGFQGCNWFLHYKKSLKIPNISSKNPQKSRKKSQKFTKSTCERNFLSIGIQIVNNSETSGKMTGMVDKMMTCRFRADWRWNIRWNRSLLGFHAIKVCRFNHVPRHHRDMQVTLTQILTKSMRRTDWFHSR